MEILGFKRFSYGAILALAVLLFLLIAGAMFFADEVDDFFGHRDTSLNYRLFFKAFCYRIHKFCIKSRECNLPEHLDCVKLQFC